MKPLKTCQRVLMWLSGVPPDESDSKGEKTQYILLTLIIITSHLLAAISGSAFIYRNISIDLEETLYSLFHTIGSWSTLYQCIATIVLRRKLNAIFTSLAKIYSESEIRIDISSKLFNLIDRETLIFILQLCIF